MLYIYHGNVGYTVMDSLIINSEFVIMTFASPHDVKYNHLARHSCFSDKQKTGCPKSLRNLTDDIMFSDPVSKVLCTFSCF